tara:strand:+ start:1778 stop:1912 length:135 start_codon:yes stop_codon:yes gene_type:complete
MVKTLINFLFTLTEDNLSAAYGMYIYHVDALNIGEKIGKLAIVK